MVWVGYNELCSAVSDSGGLGILAGGSMGPEDLMQELKFVKQRTNKPSGVNIPIVRPDSVALVPVVIKRGASVFSTSAGSPKRFTQQIHDADLRVIHVVPSVAMAVKAEDAGVDAVVAEGIEAGGHDGFEEITTIALEPQVVDRVKVPFAAAGGIADSGGFAAALALGAKGVQIGTRFAVTHEARGRSHY